MRHTITAMTAALLLLALAGCSSADNPPSSASPKSGQNAGTEKPSSPPADDGKAQLEQAVRDYTAALFSGNESGYARLSARCQKQMTNAAWVTLAKTAHQQYGAQKATDVKVDQLSGDLARVSYGAGNIPQFEREGQPWAREGGTWRWDACPSS
ncbi:hypothetical protein GLX30_03640 [Streptomyces sp. Tu 2975]|uniref:hypothetical protein n=1 Tax=Streptomyces sp. Tu 2975 TaxID=2676871 RepID=UPI00135689A9|nr:hypothetical protein [Streptomyces sp. Tu 2975]QIP83305.1 hypothetical protein GLX30_03640 [Streptomyces sp. Tu 2975]